MTLFDIYQAAFTESELFQRILGACVVASADIHEESPGTSNHANRVIWAQALLEDALTVARELFWSALRDPVIVAAIAEGAALSDNQIQNKVDDVADGSQAP